MNEPGYLDRPVTPSNQRPVPHSSGTARPDAQVPQDACDSHLHIIDSRFPLAANVGAVPAASVEDYRLLQNRLGTTRAVIVQAKVHGTDHRCLLDALGKLDGRGCGIGVLHPTVADAELRRLHDNGMRGLRFSVWNPADTVTTIAMIEPLARRISAFGWHVQLHMSGDQIVEQAALLDRLPCPLVFDHMARLPPALGARHPAYDVVRRLIDKGNAWVKLSGAYLNTEVGPPTYSDAASLTRSWIRVAPERVVWGSDWPHVTETRRKPDDALLLDLLAHAAADADTLSRILVSNPARLYGFD